jgi:para-nitrobenzyl esterase
VATGSPNGAGLPHWPAASDKRELMEVGDHTAPVPLAATPAKIGFTEKSLGQ